jgi:DNA-binding SARP family transcriptional activator
MDPLRIRLLGPVAVLVEGRPVFPGPQGRRLLALLAVAIGHTVSGDHLTDLLWGEPDSPHDADALHSQISRLRRLLGDESIASEDHGYALCLAPASVDACRFDALIRSALDQLATDPVEALRLSLEGLDLWHGTPFGDIEDLEVLAIETQRLEELRIVAIEVAYEAELALGRPERIIPSLHAVVRDFPYREKLWYLLITALARDGRRVEALRAYDELATVLGETGLAPSPDLRTLQQQIYDEADAVAAHLAEHARPATERR